LIDELKNAIIIQIPWRLGFKQSGVQFYNDVRGDGFLARRMKRKRIVGSYKTSVLLAFTPRRDGKTTHVSGVALGQQKIPLAPHVVQAVLDQAAQKHPDQKPPYFVWVLVEFRGKNRSGYRLIRWANDDDAQRLKASVPLRDNSESRKISVNPGKPWFPRHQPTSSKTMMASNLHCLAPDRAFA